MLKNNNVIEILEFSIIILIGNTCKKKFIEKIFSDEQIFSIKENTNLQELFLIIEKRLIDIKLTIIELDTLDNDFINNLTLLSKKYYCNTKIFLFNIKEENNNFSIPLISNNELRVFMKNLKIRGLNDNYIINSIKELESLVLKTKPLPSNLKNEIGYFDIIGDIHGCFEEIVILLKKLNYNIEKVSENDPYYLVYHNENRKIIFLGDLIDRGPNSPEVLKLAMSIVSLRKGFCVLGNHDHKLKRYLQGNDVKIGFALKETIEQIKREPIDFQDKIRNFLESLNSHYVLDNGNLVVTHAGIKEKYQCRHNKDIMNFGLYGESTQETGVSNYPIRLNWANDYNGKAMVVYGHNSNFKHEWINNTLCIDTACVFGGTLTALRYPEKELVSVNSLKKYWEK